MESEQATTNSRDHLIDNLKSILIATVVIGHFIEPYTGQSVILKTIFICIYSFHIPLFVFISGYLSKNGASAHKLISTLLLPYMLFSLLWHLREGLHTGNYEFNILSPSFHLWYLLALFNWRLLLPLYQSLRYGLAVSILVSLLVGLSPSVENSFALSRTLSLFPFFLLGVMCPSQTLHALHQRKYLAVAGAIILCVLGYYVTQHPQTDWPLFFWNQPYQVANFSNIGGLMFRFCLLISAGLTGLAIIVSTPAKKLFYTFIGSRTITIYIIHGFLVKSFFIRFPVWNQSVFVNAIILILPLLVVYISSLSIIATLYARLIDFLSKIVLQAGAGINKSSSSAS